MKESKKWAWIISVILLLIILISVGGVLAIKHLRDQQSSPMEKAEQKLFGSEETEEQSDFMEAFVSLSSYKVLEADKKEGTILVQVHVPDLEEAVEKAFDSYETSEDQKEEEQLAEIQEEIIEALGEVSTKDAEVRMDYVPDEDGNYHAVKNEEWESVMTGDIAAVFEQYFLQLFEE